jgi:hypothetical protein
MRSQKEAGVTVPTLGDAHAGDSSSVCQHPETTKSLSRAKRGTPAGEQKAKVGHGF